jgi:Transglutaminase-like superfamily
MNRRSFLQRTGLTAAGLALWDRRPLHGQSTPPAWRTFEITTRVNVLQARGATRVWLPAPLAVAPYQKTMGDTYHPGEGTAVMIETNANEPDMLGCSWDDGVEPVLTLVSRVATTGYAATLDTPMIHPNIAKARAIFDAITADPPQDSRAHLAITSRFVDRCRSAGIAARTVYGLALSSANATTAQECRAEVNLEGMGWVPIDLSRPGTGFGLWEMNWIAYNFAHDVKLRGSTRTPLDYFMYPQGETVNGPLDSLDPERFRYTISVREIDPIG